MEQEQIQEGSKSLGKDFKIPKKRDSDGKCLDTVQQPTEVLSNSYYEQTQDTSTHYSNSLKEGLPIIKEKPKVFDPSYIRKQIIPDLADDTLPKELTLQFQPLYCKLCSMQLTSNAMAKLHYKSKNHEKKVRKFLVEYSEQTGEPLHKRARTEPNVNVKKEEDNDPRFFHCEVCDLPLTGKMHAESHYMGKNHQKALFGYKAPAGKGHYDNDGKWIRVKSDPKKVLEDGEDTFGLDFRKKEESENNGDCKDITQETSTSEKSPSQKFSCSLCNIVVSSPELLEVHIKGQKHQKKLKQDKKELFSCSICNVTALSPELLEIHYKGQKHQKKSKQLGLLQEGKKIGELFSCSVCNISTSSAEHLEIHYKGQKHQKKLKQLGLLQEDKQIGDPTSTTESSKFRSNRTPTGQFYCKTCDLSLDSEVQFQQHMEGKNHAKKSKDSK